MKKLLLAASAAALAFAAPNAANATILLPGSTMQPTQPFVGAQGTLLASTSTAGTALTFAAIFNAAVYQTAAGTLDFYYQVVRTGPGTVRNDEIRSFTVSDFTGFSVDAFEFQADPDGAGTFRAINNAALANGTASGSTSTFGRSLSGGVLTTEFGLNGLSGTENSATYVFRTNATNFNQIGTFGVIDGSTLAGLTFAPAAAVPEPGTWAMMLLGFGAIGFGLRRRRRISLPQMA